MADNVETTESTEKRKGFIARTGTGAARYAGRRFGNSFINKVGIDSVLKGATNAKEAMSPEDLDVNEFKAGLEGRYKDGGVARFEEQMRIAGVTAKDLPALAKSRKVSAQVMFAASALFLLIGAYMIITAQQGNNVLYGLSTASMSIIFIVTGIRHEFSRWQIEQRRFGGFKEFVGKSEKTGKSKEIVIK
jgi:hypothetical protein